MRRIEGLAIGGALLGAGLLGLLGLPFVALIGATSPHDILAALGHPSFSSALGLSLQTTVVSLIVIVAGGTPLAWWLARSGSAAARVAEGIVELPIVIPPAVVGVGLLLTFGQRGLFGPSLEAMGLTVSFSPAAVVLAQVVVAAPFYVQAAAGAFRKVDADLMVVARSLGASPSGAFVRVALPLAAPGLRAGASLAWARALGEFGATLLFAGNLTGRTQTMPLAIFVALESDVRLAVVLSLMLAATGVGLLVVLRRIPEGWRS